MADLHDITPNHSPTYIAREMEAAAPNASAGFCLLLLDDGHLWWRSAGHTGKELLWALEKAKLQLLEVLPDTFEDAG